MILQNKWYSYIVLIFVVGSSLAESATIATPGAFIDERIVGYIKAKAQELFHCPINALTAEQCAKTLSGVINETAVINKSLSALVCQEATSWLSGKYGFSTRTADASTMEAYVVIVTQARCLNDINKPFEVLYPLSSYRAPVSHSTFLREVDNIVKFVIHNSTLTVVINSPWAEAIKRTVRAFKRPSTVLRVKPIRRTDVHLNLPLGWEVGDRVEDLTKGNVRCPITGITYFVSMNMVVGCMNNPVHSSSTSSYSSSTTTTHKSSSLKLRLPWS